MLKKTALALVAVATVGLTSPALAQAFDPEIGPGNQASPVYAVTIDRQVQRPVVQHRVSADAYGAYAYAPYAMRDYNEAPAATGGGTLGYNHGLVDPNY
jgi:hypothetical protein